MKILKFPLLLLILGVFLFPLEVSAYHGCHHRHGCYYHRHYHHGYYCRCHHHRCYPRHYYYGDNSYYNSGYYYGRGYYEPGVNVRVQVN